MNENFALNYLLEPSSYALSFLFLLFYTRKNKQVKIRVLVVYYFIATLLMIRAVYVESNIELYNLLCLLTFVCLGTYFYYTYEVKWKKRLVIILCLLHGVYFVSYNLVLPPALLFDSAGHVFLSIGIVIMTFLYMHQILTNVTEEPLSYNFDFWFVSTQLIYHVGAFGIFLTYRYLTQRILPTDLYSHDNRVLIGNVFVVHNVLLFLTSLLLSIAILWISFRRKSPSSL